MTTEANFLKDVATHEMTVLHEAGIYRHVRYARPGDSCYRFDLVTYPGHLVMSGDMGTWVFSRLHDMFEFFRTDRRKDGSLRINEGYWSEKLVAVDGNRRSGGAMEYRQELMEAVIKEQRLQWIRERELDKEQRRELWENLDVLLDELQNDEIHDYQLVNDWDWKPFGRDARHGYHFQDLWDHNFKEYTFHFTWACYAIAWGIQKYDESKP